MSNEEIKLASYEKALQKSNIPYDKVYIGNSVHLRSSIWGVKSFYLGERKKNGLGFIQSVKSHIIENLENQIICKNEVKKYYPNTEKDKPVFWSKSVNYKGIQYTKYCNVKDFVGKFYEIDINSAYVTSAKNNGLLSIEKHKEIIETIKKDKNMKLPALTAIGSLASSSSIYRYENGQERLIGNTYPDTYPAQRLIARSVSNLMLSIENITPIYMFWVDAIYCNVNSIEAVCKTIEKNGFEWKIKEGNSALDNNKLILEFENEKKEFTLPRYYQNM